MPKKGRHSVGVAPQYASSLGKNANCQTLVSVTLAPREVPVMVGLHLFLPESWTGDPERMARAKIPVERQVVLSKPEIAIEEIDRVRHAGVRLGCVLADAGYGTDKVGQRDERDACAGLDRFDAEALERRLSPVPGGPRPEGCFPPTCAADDAASSA